MVSAAAKNNSSTANRSFLRSVPEPVLGSDVTMAEAAAWFEITTTGG
jgi:hypothetical protein